MKIGIDARFYGSVGKGLGRYAQKLIENLENIDDENQYFVFLLKENFDEFQPNNKNFQKVLADFRWYTFAEQIKFPLLLRKYNLDVMHFPHFNVPIFYRKKIIITIHDLILLNFPTLRGTRLNPIFYWLKFLAYKLTIGSAIRRSQRMITVSNFSKEDILKNYPKLKKEKVAVTYEACDLKNKIQEAGLKNSDKILEKYGIIKPHLLYVGNAYPHKNLEGLLGAWKIYDGKNKNLKLVLVGKKDFFYRRIQKKIKKEKIVNVVLAGFVSDEDLDAVYQESTAYIFPSLYEGFGLPPLEAMAMGVPVISSNHGCMQEILGDSARYFDARNFQSIIAAIEKITQDENLRKELIQKGYQKIKEYSWEKMARETLRIYNDV